MIPGNAAFGFTEVIHPSYSCVYAIYNHMGICMHMVIGMWWRTHYGAKSKSEMDEETGRLLTDEDSDESGYGNRGCCGCCYEMILVVVEWVANII